MKVLNIGIIIRNDHDDTFPVALTPQMVQIIQNLLTQIPKMQANILGADGKPTTANESIPIIPREVEFDWAAAYAPMDGKEEMELMKALAEKYNRIEAFKTAGEEDDLVEVGDKIIKLNEETGKPAMLQDKLNPFNLGVEGTGQSNVGMSEEEVSDAMKDADQKLVDDANYPDPLKDKEIQQDVTVEVDALNLGAESPALGGE